MVAGAAAHLEAYPCDYGPSMFRTSTTTAASVAATVLTIAACSSSAAPELAVFDRPATAEDAVPEGVDLPQEVGEVRYIGEVEGSRVYAAQGPADHPWCVVVLTGTVEDGAWVAGSSCADDTEFEERGVSATVDGAEVERGTALLLPDDFSGELQDDWQVAGPNLAEPIGS
ncbi:hypothetical protein [Modestobacter sp. VKM Ac-2984]|uniref:hypothetical protein n=1 Tax=Modestobacter sp. VKM Ac-2984 TaxID=3004138 RepID=UPI0022AA5D04|nr:hypothetical protein [Modestobacter sp. VKM Ac-2984]MCZ2815246.1 hypothetical protein [Modestobacter sp. VKM Ac-2984]